MVLEPCVYAPLPSESIIFWPSRICHCLHICLILLHGLVFVNSCNMNDKWAFWLLFSTFHLLFKLGIVWVWALSLLPGPCPLLSRVYRLAGAPTMSLHFSYYDITYPFTFLLPLSLQVEAPASPFLTFFLLLGFTSQHSY